MKRSSLAFRIRLGAALSMMCCVTLVYLFFRNYRGTMIPYATLWFWAGIPVAASGVGMLLWAARGESRRVKSLADAERERYYFDMSFLPG